MKSKENLKLKKQEQFSPKCLNPVHNINVKKIHHFLTPIFCLGIFGTKNKDLPNSEKFPFFIEIIENNT